MTVEGGEHWKEVMTEASLEIETDVLQCRRSKAFEEVEQAVSGVT
jgi:hypothetical protein